MQVFEDQELLALLHDLESDRVERKESLADRKKAGQAICAFANDLPGHRQPGVLFIGAKDDGTCTGQAVTDELLLQLANFRDDGQILPLPSMTVEKRVLDGCELAVVVVQPSQSPPVRYRDRVWIRVGPRRAVATPEEERRLAERRRASDLPFDLRSLPSAHLDDLDLELFRRQYLPAAVAPDVLAANRRTPEEQLLSLRFLDRDRQPTVLGVLVLGRDPRRFVPGFYIQFLRIDGSRLTDPIRDQKEIGGPLSDLLRRLDDVLIAHNAIATRIDAGPREVRRPDYPPSALQQLTRNAVLHRDYETTHAPVRITWFNDRIEIHSPGGPFGQVTIESLGEPSLTDYRNPHLAESMRVLGFVQRFGVGIQLARKALEDNDQPPLRLEASPSAVLAIVEKGK